MRDDDIKWDIITNLKNVNKEIADFLSKSPHGSLFQSPQWTGQTDKAGKSFIVCAFKDNRKPIFGALILKSLIPGTRYFVGTIRRGPVFKKIDTALSLWSSFEKQVLDKGVISLIVNPYWEYYESMALKEYLAINGYKLSHELSGHSETLVIDLSKSEEDIFKNSVDSKTRNMIRKGLRMNIKSRPAESLDEIKQFRDLHQKMAQIKNIKGPSLEEFKNIFTFTQENPGEGVCILSWLDHNMVGGCIILRHGCRMVYSWGASTDKRLKGVPKTENALWESILWAKKTGAALFDLGGVKPGAEKKSDFALINSFKMGFSRDRIKLFPTLQKDFKPFLCKSHKLLKIAAKIIRP